MSQIGVSMKGQCGHQSMSKNISELKYDLFRNDPHVGLNLLDIFELNHKHVKFYIVHCFLLYIAHCLVENGLYRVVQCSRYNVQYSVYNIQFIQCTRYNERDASPEPRVWKVEAILEEIQAILSQGKYSFNTVNTHRLPGICFLIHP